MRVISVQVGKPKSYEWNGKTILSSVLKHPVEGPVALVGHNLAGDEQSDLTVHGGEWKAVYAYPLEHYDYWDAVLPGAELPYGAFGENLTIEGLLEEDVLVGDIYRIGTAELIATQPRLPCYKLGIRLSRDDMVQLFLDAEKPGVYFAVRREGDIGAGDQIELIERATGGVSILELMQLKLDRLTDAVKLEIASQLTMIPPSWREKFSHQLLSER